MEITRQTVDEARWVVSVSKMSEGDDEGNKMDESLL